MVYQYRSGILLSILSSSLYVTYVCWEKSVKGEKRNVKDCNSGNDSLYIYSYTLICLEDLLLVETARCIHIWYMYIPLILLHYVDKIVWCLFLDFIFYDIVHIKIFILWVYSLVDLNFFLWFLIVNKMNFFLYKYIYTGIKINTVFFNSFILHMYAGRRHKNISSICFGT